MTKSVDMSCQFAQDPRNCSLQGCVACDGIDCPCPYYMSKGDYNPNHSFQLEVLKHGKDSIR